MILSDGTTLKADMILVGVGIFPNTEYVGQSVATDKKLVVTDQYLTTSDENIYAAGDITSYPYFNTGERVCYILTI